MNIDLRNICEDFEKQVNEVKEEFGFSTNSMAVKHCTINYLKQRKLIEELRKTINAQCNELDTMKKDVKMFTGALSRLNKIT
jgi:archaellum component FlaC